MVDIHKIWFKDAKDILIIIWLQQIFELNVIQAGHVIPNKVL